MKKNTYNQVGATYLAVNINGYSYDKSPFVALSGLWIETLGKTPRYRSKQWEELARKPLYGTSQIMRIALEHLIMNQWIKITYVVECY